MKKHILLVLLAFVVAAVSVLTVRASFDETFPVYRNWEGCTSTILASMVGESVHVSMHFDSSEEWAGWSPVELQIFLSSIYPSERIDLGDELWDFCFPKVWYGSVTITSEGEVGVSVDEGCPPSPTPTDTPTSTPTPTATPTSTATPTPTGTPTPTPTATTTVTATSTTVPTVAVTENRIYLPLVAKSQRMT